MQGRKKRALDNGIQQRNKKRRVTLSFDDELFEINKQSVQQKLPPEEFNLHKNKNFTTTFSVDLILKSRFSSWEQGQTLEDKKHIDELKTQASMIMWRGIRYRPTDDSENQAKIVNSVLFPSANKKDTDNNVEEKNPDCVILTTNRL